KPNAERLGSDPAIALSVLVLDGLRKSQQPTEKENNSGRPGPRIYAEALDLKKAALLREAGADEVVCHEDFGLKILAQSVFQAQKLVPGDYTKVYAELLRFKGNEIHFVPLK